MGRRTSLVLILLFAGCIKLQAQNDILTIDNGIVSRSIDTAGGHVSGCSYKMVKGNSEFLQSNSEEFSFTVDGTEYNGLSDWKNIRKSDIVTEKDGKGIVLSFESTSGTPFTVELQYITYPDMAAVHKSLRIINNGTKDIKVENVDVEAFRVNWPTHQSRVHHYYGRRVWVGPYVGDWNDPLAVLHSLDGRKGLAIGNEATGVTKRTALLEQESGVSAGLTHTDQDFAFRKWIAPGESWTSPRIFTIPYTGTADPSWVLNTGVSDFVRKHMGVRIEELSRKPMFGYNTWSAFGRGLNEKLVIELAEAAAECGVEEFLIDDGWQFNFDPEKNSIWQVGDWRVDTVKFPNGLKPVFDHIKSLGMKPGLWVSVGSAETESRVFREHPEWFVKDEGGQYVNLHADGPVRTACMSTDWSDYIRDILLGLVRDHGLTYLKLDFAIVTSAYIYDNSKTGCYAGDHPYHKDRNESFAMNYERCMKLFDDIHREAPELYIDCTYETAGKYHLIDYGFAKHAEGDWLSNITQKGPLGAMLVRRLAWERTPAIPATSLVIGNMFIDDEYHELAYKSLTGTLPVMLGDPRKLSAEQKARYRSWTAWMSGLEDRHGIMSFRQDIPGFGEPREGFWDGFCRVNTETNSGGLIGVFRQGAKEKSRFVTVPWLDAGKTYAVKKGFTGETIATLTGKQLEEDGFMVTITEEYDGELFEVTEFH